MTTFTSLMENVARVHALLARVGLAALAWTLFWHVAVLLSFLARSL
ncbi:hypothetical protein [Nonomuraea maritima]